VHPPSRHSHIGRDLAAVAVASIAAYAASLGGYFLSDDFHVVTLLNTARSAVDWRNALSDFIGVYRGDPTHSYYRPLITLSAAIDYTLWGPNPFGGHLTNLLLNMLNGLLVYGIARTLPPPPAREVALTAGLLFSLHPLHPEAVYWLVGRTELIMTCFVLLSILAYLLYAARRRAIWLWLSILAFALALASKETAVVVPFALTLHRLLYRDADSRHPTLRALAPVVPHYVLLVAYLAFRKAITGHVVGRYGEMTTNLVAPSLMPRGLIHLVAYQLYPIGGDLLASAGDEILGEIPRRLMNPLGWLLVLTIVAVVIAGRMDRRAWFCLGLMLISASPLLSLFAERGSPDDAPRIYYLPSAGFCLLLAALLVGTAPRLRRWLTSIIMVAFSLLLAANSLPWIRAGRITSEVLRSIERAANAPGVNRVVVIGRPDFYFGAELFGDRGWALAVAAAPPFARIPPGTRIIAAPEDACGRFARGELRDDEGTRVLKWDAERLSLDGVAWGRMPEICRALPQGTS